MIINESAYDVPTDALEDGNGFMSFIFQAEDGDIRVNIGADAGTDAGHIVYEATSAVFNNIGGQRVSVYALNGSVYTPESDSESEADPLESATIEAKFNLVPTL